MVYFSDVLITWHLNIAGRMTSSSRNAYYEVGDRVRWRLVRKLGSGSFGDIWLGINSSNGEEVAVKLEPANARHPQLLYESKVYKIMQVRYPLPQLI